MSFGITPYDFVQQVYYAQEKVILDFWPCDDKYKEVLMEANLLLQELQNSEDWGWLRERLVLGDCRTVPNEIPEFKLPPWVYKPSTLYHDTLKLYRPVHRHHCHHGHCGEWPGHDEVLDMLNYIDVPIASTGDNGYRKEYLHTGIGAIHINDLSLKAVLIGDVVTFNRLLLPEEARRVAVMDVQRRMKPAHICGDHCKGVKPDEPISYERDENGEWVNPCAKIEKRLYTEVPDPNYMVMATAARHAAGSPPASARALDLQDTAQKILSAMRQNDAAATEPDWLDWDPLGYVEIV